MILKSSKSRTSKSPKDYQVEKIVSFEVNSMTLKSSIALTLKSALRLPNLNF